MSEDLKIDLETDPRFPSGRWAGFFLQKQLPGKHQMELLLTFRNGEMAGEGRDLIARFTIRGRYTTADGKCYWHKRYEGLHDVFYRGFNEGKGIWGTWELDQAQGGFHIWPEHMGDQSEQTLVEELPVPVEAKELVEVGAAPG